MNFNFFGKDLLPGLTKPTNFSIFGKDLMLGRMKPTFFLFFGKDLLPGLIDGEMVVTKRKRAELLAQLVSDGYDAVLPESKKNAKFQAEQRFVIMLGTHMSGTLILDPYRQDV